MHEQKYRYFIDGKEVDNRTDYLNATMSGDYVSYFDGDSVFSVSFSNFFAENKDNNKMIKREVNGHLSDILDLGQIVGDLEGINKPPKTEQLNYQSFYQVVYTKPISNWNKFEIAFSDKDLEKIKDLSIGDIKEMFNNQNFAEKTEKEENLVFPKDSEIHKEELPPFTTNYPDDYFKRLMDVYTENSQRPITFTVSEGVKTNSLKPQMSLLFKQFPKALESIVMCSQYGHEKYKETDKDYLNYTRVDGGSKTYADAGLRHRLQQGNDLESGLPHQFHVAWNALAELELWIKENI